MHRGLVRRAVKRMVLRMWGRLPLWTRYLLLWLVNPKYIIGVLGLVTDEQGRVLLFCHSYRGATPWALPGGAVKRLEGLAAALEREFQEESGWHIVVENLMLVDNRERRLLDFVFRCRIVNGEFRPSDEVRSLAYFPPAALPPDTEPRHRAIVRELFGLDAAASSGWHGGMVGVMSGLGQGEVTGRHAPDQTEGVRRR
ncbi:MAG: hypothetical protein C4289_10505 [Chloroflexota bacterium]